MAILLIYLIALGISLGVFYAIARELSGKMKEQNKARQVSSLNNGTTNLFSNTSDKIPDPTPRENIRTLMFGWEFPPHNSGGLGVACQGLAHALKKDSDIVFVLPKELPPGMQSLYFVSAGIPTHALHSNLSPYPGSRTTSGTNNVAYGDDIVGQVRRYAKAAGAIAAREPHDVIYAHDWLSFGAGIEAKKISGKPLIAHVHATEFERTGGGSINQAVYDLEREGLHAADAIIAVSHRTKQFVIEQYGIAAHKIHVVWNGIDDITAPQHTAHNMQLSRLAALKSSGSKLVLFMGRITVQKGADYMLRAAKIVLEKNPETYFLIAGAGHMRDQIIEEAAALGIAGRVLFAGFLRGAEQAEAYALADLFVMPSVTEPFGITALEAMRAGTPVLMSKQSGVSEAVVHALRSDFWDVEEMARQMHLGLTNEAVRTRLQSQGPREASALTWNLAASKVRDVMDSLVLPQLAMQSVPA